MTNFKIINAISVRREDDDLEVEFISRHELRYFKKQVQIIIFTEIMIAADGAPDGRLIYLEDHELDTEKRIEVENDLTAASVPLRTKFHFC